MVETAWLMSLMGGRLKAQTVEVAPLSLPGNPLSPLPVTSPPSQNETPLPSRWPENPLNPPPALVPASEKLPDTIPDTINVEGFRFTGNTVFSQEELAEVVAEFAGKELTFSQLLAVRAYITEFYVAHGYITSGAYLPPQTLEGGVVTIAIIEGQLEAINVTVEGKLSPDYVRDRLALASGPPLNQDRLQEALQLLQLSPLIERISADLAASPQPGRSILNVSVVTARSFYPRVVLDNGRNPQVGSFRRGVELSDINLTGIGDTLAGSYRNTDGSDDLEFSYSFPVNSRNGSLRLSFRNLTGKIIEPPLSVLNITSDYQKYGLSFRQPIWQTFYQEFAVGLDIDHQTSKTLFNPANLGEQPLIGRGTDNQGRTQVSTLRFFQEWVSRSEREVLAFRSEFNWGIDAFGTTIPFDIRINPDAPDSTFFMWRGQAQWVLLLAPDTLFVVRTDFQLADSPLVSLEQFTLGGLGSVEGYRQNTLLTDNGLLASVEFRLPLVRLPRENAVLQLIPFVDFGTGWNSGNVANPAVNTLASIGLGLQWQYSDRFSARLDFAHRLGEVPFFSDNTWQDNGILFTIIMSP